MNVCAATKAAQGVKGVRCQSKTESAKKVSPFGPDLEASPGGGKKSTAKRRNTADKRDSAEKKPVIKFPESAALSKLESAGMISGGTDR